MSTVISWIVFVAIGLVLVATEGPRTKAPSCTPVYNSETSVG
jgi:hypothetical protein